MFTYFITLVYIKLVLLIHMLLQRWDSNPQLSGYEPDALTIALLCYIFIAFVLTICVLVRTFATTAFGASGGN